MKDLIKLPYLIIVWIFYRILRIIRSLFVRFIFKKDQVYMYNGCWDFVLYRVTYVPLFGSPSFNLIHLSTFETEDFVRDEIRYDWNLLLYNYYGIYNSLREIPYDEYIPIENLIRETQTQIDSIVKDAKSRGNHPSEFKPGMTMLWVGNYIYHLERQTEEPDSWITSHIKLDESLPLIEECFSSIFYDDDKIDCIVIPESVWHQTKEISKDRHAVLKKMLLSLKKRYKANDKQDNLDAVTVFPWGIY